MSEPALVEARIRTTQIVVAGLCVGVLIFTAVVVALVATGVMGEGARALASLPLYGAFGAALLLAIAPMVRRRMLESGPAPNPDTVIGRWFAGTIVAMALTEGAGLLGLSLSLVAGSAVWAVVFGVASVAAMVLSWPRGADLTERIRRIPG